MKNSYAFLTATFLCLVILALYLVSQALPRGDITLFLVLIITALIFWNRLQEKRS